MEVSRIRALRGPNLWSRHTAIEAIITCAEIECFIDRIPGFEARLREHHSGDERGHSNGDAPCNGGFE